MKKIILISVLAVIAVACHQQEPRDLSVVAKTAAEQRIADIYGEGVIPVGEIVLSNDTLCVIKLKCTKPDSGIHVDEFIYFDNGEKSQSLLTSDKLKDRDESYSFSVVKMGEEILSMGNIAADREAAIALACKMLLEE
ncbi:MAG: hypothetical protein J6Y98_06440 [Bacteroidales bacterium]|nr:hypothetical protein [Bacteroidales bacterium]MCR5192472.1 hypothetical protein [Bacteroidales bacterium]